MQTVNATTLTLEDIANMSADQLSIYEKAIKQHQKNLKEIEDKKLEDERKIREQEKAETLKFAKDLGIEVHPEISKVGLTEIKAKGKITSRKVYVNFGCDDSAGVLTLSVKAKGKSEKELQKDILDTKIEAIEAVSKILA